MLKTYTYIVLGLLGIAACKKEDCQQILYVGIVNNNFSDNISLFPNPTDGKLQIDFGKVHSRIEIRINDDLGKLVYKDIKLHSKQINIDINYLASGIYFLTMRENSQVVTYKILKK